MSTILERMREGAVCKESGNRCRSVEARSGCDCAAAADEIEALQMEKEFNASQYRAEIERLTAENERLSAALDEACRIALGTDLIWSAVDRINELRNTAYQQLSVNSEEGK